MWHYWSSSDIIGHLSQYWSSYDIIGHLSHYWSSYRIIGHHVILLVIMSRSSLCHLAYHRFCLLNQFVLRSLINITSCLCNVYAKRSRDILNEWTAVKKLKFLRLAMMNFTWCMPGTKMTHTSRLFTGVLIGQVAEHRWNCWEGVEFRKESLKEWRLVANLFVNGYSSLDKQDLEDFVRWYAKCHWGHRLLGVVFQVQTPKWIHSCYRSTCE